MKANGVNGAGSKDSRVGSVPDTGDAAGVARSVISEFPGRDKTIPVIGEGGRFRVASLNVGMLRGKSLEVLGILDERRVDICCLQEVRWKGEGQRF